MKRATMFMAAVVLAVLATGALATRAGAAEAARPAHPAVLDPLAAALGLATLDAPSSAPAQACEDVLERRVLADLGSECSFGAPRCFSNGSCDSWCFPFQGLCLSGCCACQ